MAEVKFEQISPADFFYRNRDIAGFSNPARSLYMSIRELVENSFPYEEPILVREEGRIKVMRIGEFVERELSDGGYIEVDHRYYKPLRKRIEVLTIDENLKLAFKRITAVYKHPSPRMLWKVRIQQGREVCTTSSHNLFILNDELQLDCRETKELKRGDRVIVPAAGYEPENPLEELNIFEELLRLAEKEAKNIKIKSPLRLHAKSSLPQTQLLLTSIRGVETQWRALCELAENIDMDEPDNIGRALGKGSSLENLGKADRGDGAKNRPEVEEASVGKDPESANYSLKRTPRGIDDRQASIGVKRPSSKIPTVIPITPEFVRILGYYTSRGSITEGKKVLFSFRPRELKTAVKDLINCLEMVLGIKDPIIRPRKTTIDVIVESAPLAFLFEKVLEAGTDFINKRIPWLVFNVSRKLMWHFMAAYVAGDGYLQRAKGGQRITLTTSSKSLFTDLKFLLTLMGVNFSAYISKPQERHIKGRGTIPRQSCRIHILRTRFPGSQSIPIARYRHELLRVSRHRYSNLYRRTVQKSWLKDAFSPDQLPDNLRRIIFSDIGSLRVESVELVESNSEWVYDISVEGVERFIGGEAIALLHNSLDACEVGRIPPNIIVELSSEGDSEEGTLIYRLKVEDNGIGVAARHIPYAFATVFYGSKYGYKQSRGTFGLGGTMALLYGQITTNKPATVVSSQGGNEIHKFVLMIDITKNEPRIFSHEVIENKRKWRGTLVEFYLEGDYATGRPKIIDYLNHTAIANPHASIMFIDPRGRLYYYPRIVDKVPEPPKEMPPHPVGVDVETMSRLPAITREKTLLTFLMRSFQRVGARTAREILELAGLPEDMNPKKLSHDEITRLVDAIKKYDKFRAPDPSSVSPIGKDLLEAGIKHMLNPEFLHVVQRPPSSYSGYPFVIEVGIAWGGGIKPSDAPQLYRFANKIPLLYDERADVVWKVVSERIDWSTYKVSFPTPLAILTHICSPKVPYKSVGKEAVADRPEIERELIAAIREAARWLRLYLSNIERRAIAAKRLDIYARYLPLIAKYSADLADRGSPPNIDSLLKSLGVDREMIEMAKKKAEDRLRELYAE